MQLYTVIYLALNSKDSSVDYVNDMSGMRAVFISDWNGAPVLIWTSRPLLQCFQWPQIQLHFLSHLFVFIPQKTGYF